MRKLLTMTLAGAVLTSALLGAPALAGKNTKRRVAEAPYTGAVLGTESTDGGYCLTSPNIGCMDFTWLRGERSVVLEIRDATGLPVYGAVGQWIQGPDNNYTSDMVYFCGKTTPPFKIDPKKGDLAVFLYDAGPLPECPGVATSGKVVATFSR